MSEVYKKRRDYGEPSEDPAGGESDLLARRLLDGYLSGEEFSYDPEKDPAYLSLRDSYVDRGRQAMKDVYAEASGLTGGYGNSYAASAGAKAYGDQLEKLNDRIPELVDAAYRRYSDGRDDAYKKFRTASDYYADLLDRYYNDRKFYSSLDEQDYEDAYREYADRLAYEKWLSQFGYEKERDAVSDGQWERRFALDRARYLG